jgi:hypothetical protein
MKKSIRSQCKFGHIQGRFFNTATSFNKLLESWKTSKVIYMQDLFYHAESFNQLLNSWDVSCQ